MPQSSSTCCRFGRHGVDRAAKIRNRAQEIARAERVPFSVAFRRAEGETAGSGQ